MEGGRRGAHRFRSTCRARRAGSWWAHRPTMSTAKQCANNVGVYNQEEDVMAKDHPVRVRGSGPGDRPRRGDRRRSAGQMRTDHPDSCGPQSSRRTLSAGSKWNNPDLREGQEGMTVQDTTTKMKICEEVGLWSPAGLEDHLLDPALARGRGRT